MSIFSLKEVKAEQVKNIANNNFGSWPESATYGYYGGGSYDPATAWYAIPRLDFATSTVSLPTNNLPDFTRGIASASSNSYGYFAGGNCPPTSSNSSSVLRFDFSNEIVSNPGKNLPSILVNAESVQSSNNAYFGGGINTPASFSSVSNIVRFQFSTETINVPGNNLPSAREQMGGLSSSSYGYFGGGYFKSNTFPYPATSTSTISRLDFSNESISLPGKNLSEATFHVGTVSSIPSSYGYFAGGFPAGGGYSSTIRRFDFSTENLTDGVAFLPPAGGLGGRAGSGSTKSFDSGYFGGGIQPPANITITTISKLDFSNTTVTDLSNSLPIRVTRPAGLSGGASVYRGSKTYGYIIGGSSPLPPPATYYSTVRRLDFSTDNISLPGNNLPSGLEDSSLLSNNYYGYFCGGMSPIRLSTIRRLDFSNETVSNPGKNLPESNSNASYFSSSSYGYVNGGFNGTIFTSVVRRLDFSNETISTPGKNLDKNYDSGFGVPGNFFGYSLGGYSPQTSNNTNTVNRLDLSNETVSLPGKNLIINARVGSSLYNNSYGYLCGGFAIVPTPADVSTIQRLDFSNETISLPGKNLPNARENMGSLSGSFYGYVIGGYFPTLTGTTSIISRLDFSTEVVSDPGKNIADRASNADGLSNSN